MIKGIPEVVTDLRTDPDLMEESSNYLLMMIEDGSLPEHPTVSLSHPHRQHESIRMLYF